MENILEEMTSGFQKVVEFSTNNLKSYLDSATKGFDGAGKVLENLSLGKLDLGKMKFPVYQNKDCCAPRQECPPQCLAEIQRCAYVGERIIVPFVVKNTCGGTRTYRIGVRELKSLDGTPAPSQPQLSKVAVTLSDGQSETVLMGISLNGFTAGQPYETTIVLRERDINQNICFRLNVEGFGNAPVVKAIDERKYRLRWQGWQSHFYCDAPLKRIEGHVR